ncbi:MAG: type IV secretory system conjugative DNA transfer family protein, partial [Firmicutes bacterium]|nr:type IV secretory system conjugative DNA transfer family protein [Bacillota bacterium]
RHMASVYDMLAGHTIDDLDAIFSALPYNHPAKPSYNIFSHAQKKVKSDIAIGLGTRLSVFQNSQVRTLTEASDIDLELPGKEKSIYYCIIPDTDETFRFLSSLFFTFLFIKLTRLADKHNGPCPVKINFIMDEFCNIGKIPNFEERISTMRSRGIYCMVITQDLPQLQGHFATRSNSRVWQEIIACCDTRMFWAVNDTDTARYLTELLGKGTVEQISYRHERVGLDLGHVTTSPKSRDLLDVSETMRLDMDSAVVQLRGQKPLLIKKLGYTKHPYYRELKPLPVESYVPVYKEVPEAVAEVKIIYPEGPFEEYEEEAPGVKLAAAGDAGVSAPAPSDGQDDEKIEETAGKENHDGKGSGKKNAGKKNKDKDAFWG